MSLLKSAAIVSAFTGISRVLGFVRDLLIAQHLGAGPVADAFVVAFRLPNLFRRLFAEGAFNSAFVPLFSGHLAEGGRAQAKQFAIEVGSVLFFILLGVMALAQVFTPALVGLIAPGFQSDPEKFDLAILLTRIAFPYLFFMSFVALLGGILNSFHRFTATSTAPILLNVVLISVLLFLTFSEGHTPPEVGYYLVWGVSFSGLLQCGLLLISVYRAGISFKISLPRLTPAVKRFITLATPGIFAGGIMQINLVVGTMIASLQAGAASWLYYADRLYQLPLGLIGVAIGIVLLPALSRSLREGNIDHAHTHQNRAIEFSMLFSLPATVGLSVIALPLIQVLFERGAFTYQDSVASAHAVIAFCLGLPAYVLIKVFSPGFFAREDTKTPMKFAIMAAALNIILGFGFFYLYGHIGIALATSIAAWLNAGLLGFTLIRRGDFIADSRLKKTVPRMVLASVIMGGFLIMVLSLGNEIFFFQTTNIMRTLGVSVLVIGGAMIYAIFGVMLGCTNVAEIKNMLSRQKAINKDK